MIAPPMQTADASLRNSKSMPRADQTDCCRCARVNGSNGAEVLPVVFCFQLVIRVHCIDPSFCSSCAGRRSARPAACRRSTSDLLILRPTQGLASKNKGELTLASSNRRARLAGMRPPFESGLLGLLVWAPISHPPSGPPAKNPLAPPSPRALAFLSSSPFITTSDRERPSPLRPPHFLFRPSVASFQLESIPLPHLPFTHRLPVHSLFFFRPGVSLAFSFLRPTLL